MKTRLVSLKTKTIIGIAIAVAIVGAVFAIFSPTNNLKSDESILDVSMEQESEIIELTYPNSLFRILADEDDLVMVKGKVIPLKTNFELKPEFEDIYEGIRIDNTVQKTVVVVPIFTASAYWEPGFYTYYSGKCDSSCLTSKIQNESSLNYHSSANAVKVLKLLNYDTITDIDIDKNSALLSEYDKVIMLHSEYVTKKMFEVITQHPNVVYLYPNALYAEIEVNYDDNTITLIRGHNYPEPDISNGFDWEFENTHPFEFDTACDKWEFYEIDNGMMLNCYPEQIIWQSESVLKAIKEF